MIQKLLASVVLLVFATFMLQAQNTISGTVTDAETGEPLIGTNILLSGTATGTTTDINGKFSISNDAPFPWTLDVSYTGYASQEIEVANASSSITIQLVPGAVIGQEVVISASRRREKVQEAPASITVLNARKLEASPNDNPVRNLINAPGVTIQQQSAARINIQLRGDGGLFGSASFPILDYRSLVGPGLGTFDNLNSPLNNIDIERIEVVRGPGSALYGPGVTSGVVHFISKSPIDKPGSTIQLIGGELSTFGVAARHATKVSDKFGFKINAVYKRGGEFTLDPNDERDAQQIALFQPTVSEPAVTNGVVDATKPGRQLLNQNDLDPDGDGNFMQDFWNQTVFTTAFEFRPQDDLSINVAGGFNNASAVFYNSQGEGLSQATETWAQARMQKGGFFAQAFYLRNNGGSDEKPTFLYQTGNITTINREQIEAQLQYNFDLPNFLNSNWTAGFDYRNSTADTRNFVYGRNEEDDDFGIAGLYLQTKLELDKKLDLVLAARGDRFNFTDENAFSPRAVLVYKPSTTHTMRFGYNQAWGAPSQLQVNIDFPVSSPVPGAFDIWLLGNKEAQTFAANPEIKWNGLLPFPNVPVGTPGMPLGFVQGAVTAAAGADILAQVAAGLVAANPTLEALIPAINAFLTNPANFADGTTGSLLGINLFNQQPLGTSSAPAAALRKETTWEFGYKGLIANKLAVSLDIYNREIDGATLFTAISPSYGLLGLDQMGTDLGAGVAAKLTPFLVDELTKLGLDINTATVTAGQVAAAYGAGYTAGGNAFADGIAPLANGFILGAVETQEVPDNGVTHVAAGYRTFEEYSYTGVDLGLEYYVDEDLSFFGNYSYISENIFNPVIRGTDGATEMTSISAPLNKFRLGANYAPELGFRANLAFQHDDSYTVFLGQFSGDTDVRNLVDLGLGYKFDNGLSIDVSAQNLFGTEYRYFPGFPKIGRRTLVTLTYNFGQDK